MRFYRPYQNHFAQPDTIIPNLTSSIGLNRYAHAYNNPILYNDLNGHRSAEFDEIGDDGKWFDLRKGFKL